jgi:hypothetical protein
MAAILSAETGLRPRADATEYDAYASGAGATIAAAVLTPAQAKRLFGIDLHKLGYTVVELAVFPDRDVEVAARDFMLRIAADGRTVRAASPAAIGNRTRPNAKTPKIPERVQVYGAQTVGYGTGPYNRGVYTATSVGVGIGDRPAPPPPHSPGIDTVDLEAQVLPDGRTSNPVAGYLYFPVVPKKKGVLEITWYAADGQVRLAMPPTK